ncbi:MAG: hypothetical protein FJ390_02285 [Verrucomicrobia bacterium]|nr:hypothetical protein [Verrucomicrobiota bacterium]
MMFGGARTSYGRPPERRAYYEEDDTQEERDFTQHVVSWRLGSIKTPLEEASSSEPLPLANDSRVTYYDQFLPLILEEARAAVEKGFSEKNEPFFVTIKNDVREPRERDNPWIMNLQGSIPPGQEHSPSMNVLLLEHKTGMKFLVLANEKISALLTCPFQFNTLY